MMPMMDLFGVGADINTIAAGNLYPGTGPTVASAAGAMTMSTNAAVPGDDGGQTVVTGGSSVSSGNSLAWWFGLFALLLVIVFASHRAGGPDDFKNIRPTFYNFITISLTSIVGIVGFKVIFSKWRIPGVSDIILAA